MVKRRSLLRALLLMLLCLPTHVWSQDITSNLAMHLPFDEASGHDRARQHRRQL